MIYLFYPSRILGGAELLIMNTALLLKDNGEEVAIIDIEKGWISSNISTKNIKKIIVDKTKKIKIDSDDILITTANFIYDIDKYFEKSSARVLFWAIQPYNVILRFPNIIRRFYLIESIYLKYKKIDHINNLKKIINKNGLVAMDITCDDMLFKHYNIRYEKFLPVFVNRKNFFKKNIINMNDELNVVWLGRIDLDFKIFILKKMIKDLDKFSKKSNRKIIVNVVGDGPGIEILKDFVGKNINIKINYLYEKTGKELESILINSNIGFAMGTSAIDISAKGIPTVLLDFSYSEVGYYRYRWIFKAEKYCLGREIKDINYAQMKLMNTMEEIIYDLDENIHKISELCYNYSYSNHSCCNIYGLIQEILQVNSFTINDIYSYRNTKPLWKFFTKFF